MCQLLKVVHGRSFRNRLNEFVMNEDKNLVLPRVWSELEYEEFENSLRNDLEQLRKEGMCLFFLSDPLCPECIGTTRRVIDICLGYDVPVVLIVSQPDGDVMLDIAKDKRNMIGWVILQDMQDFSGERVLVLKELHEAGYKVVVRIDSFDDIPSVYGFFQAVCPFCDLFYFRASCCDEVYLKIMIDMILDMGEVGMKVCFSNELLEKVGVFRSELPDWCVDESFCLW